MLMANVQLPGSKGYDNQMAIHTATPKEDVSLARECQKHLSKPSRKNGVHFPTHNVRSGMKGEEKNFKK